LREKVHSVTAVESASAIGEIIPVGASVAESKFIRTGPDALAHFDAGASSVRLGADSLLKVDGSAGTMELHHGSLLYQNLPAERPLAVSLDAVDVFITGGTGFVDVTAGDAKTPPTLRIGAISRETTVRFDGQQYRLNRADLLTVSSAGKVERNQFHLPKLVATCRLVNGFKTPLSDLTNIQRDARKFAALRERGFIQETEGESGGANDKRTVSANGAQAGANKSPHRSVAANGVRSGGVGVVSPSVRIGGLTIVDEFGILSRAELKHKTGNGIRTTSAAKVPTKPPSKKVTPARIPPR
jgi:hypothetical protein